MAGRWSGAGFEALNFSASFAFVGKVPGYGIVIAAWWCGVIAALQAAGRYRPDTRAFSPGYHIAGLRPLSPLRASPPCGPSALKSPESPASLRAFKPALRAEARKLGAEIRNRKAES